MSSIPGPVIVFRVSQPELQGAINPALQQIRQQAKSVSDGIAADWKRMAAQMRASVSQDAIGTKDLASSRQQLVTILDKEIAGLRTRNALTHSELTNLKAATLERERQVDAMKRGTAIGMTAGTANALSQVSTQTVLGITRMMDSIVNRYLGGAAGAAFRTVRDAGYYSSMPRGLGGGAEGSASGGVFGGLSGGISAILSSISPAMLGGGAFIGGIAATGGILVSVTDKMMKYAQAIQNQAAATGLSTVEVQRYNELAKITGVDAGSLTMAFSRMQVQLGEFVTKGQASSSGTQNLTRVLQSLGVSITTTGGALRPINEVMGDFANVLAAIPDRETRTALAMEAMGTRGRVLVQVIDEARASGESLSQALDKVAKASIPDSEIQQLLREKAAWDSLIVSIDQAKIHLEGFIATHRSDSLFAASNPGGQLGISLAGRINSYFSVPGGPGAPNAPTAANAQALIAQGVEETNKLFLERAGIIKAGGQEEYNLIQAEKKYAEAVSQRNGADAEKYAQQIENLKAIVDLEKQRARLLEEGARSPSRIGLTQQQNVDRLLGNLIHPASPLIAPNVGGGFPSAPGGMLDFLGIGGGNTATGNTLIESLTKKSEDARIAAIKDGVEKARAEYESDVQNFRMMLQMKQISQQQFNEAVALEQQTLNDRIAEAREKDLEKYKHEAGSLFDALVSGQKNIGKKLQSAMEEIVLAPLKESFSNAIARELQDLGDLFKPHSASTSGGASSAGGVIGRVYSKLGTIFGPLTPPTFPASGTTGTHWWQKLAGAGQSNVGTMRVNAGIVYIGGGIGSSGSLGGIGGAGGGIGGLLGDLPFTSQGIQNAGSYTGLSGAGGGPAASRSGLLGMLSKIGGVAGGAAGMFAALTSANQAGGGVGGAFKGLLGGGASGAELGATIGSIVPVIGTVIGAAVGAIAGGVSGLISGILGSDWSTNVQKAMTRQNYIAPSSENFSFASNGSIANTLQTGFNQTGGQFSQYGLAANTPFWANAITGTLSWQQKQWIKQAGWSMNPNAPFLGNPETNPFIGQGPAGYHAGTSPTAVHINLNLPGYIDGQGAQAALGPHLDYIAQNVAAKVSSSASGFGSNVRRAVFPP